MSVLITHNLFYDTNFVLLYILYFCLMVAINIKDITSTLTGLRNASVTSTAGTVMVFCEPNTQLLAELSQSHFGPAEVSE